ncbi:lysophospholipid acyltransferase family protein [Propionicicella superfundia]|uniref:lysophospholipid acyltransferase family protein n=1 Tax=Propionicicella superfundia TaxID=348582 RepID=UPI000420DC67|nr:lysophospholipid acyltransferase family protein [Propionicicella superfundia]
MSEPDLSRYRSAVHASARYVAQQMVMKPYFWSALHVHIHGRSHLESLENPLVVIANHSSHLDAPLIFGALPRRITGNLATGAAADYFFEKKAKGAATSLFFNAFPVDRKGMKGKKNRGIAGALLSDGTSLLLFPEGTRSRTGAMGRFTPGAAALSISRDVPVLPIALVGAHAAMPTTASVPVNGRPHVHVVFGRAQTAAPVENAHRFSDRLRRYILELHDTTARAYGMPTQEDFRRAAALRKAAKDALATTKADKDRKADTKKEKEGEEP